MNQATGHLSDKRSANTSSRRTGFAPVGSALALFGLLLLTAATPASAAEWEPLWNGKNLDGWSTWFWIPESKSKPTTSGNETPELNPDPMRVFTIVQVDGKPAIRISGQVFGELRSTRTLQNYHLRFQFKWGEKKWPPRDKSDTPRDSGLLYHIHTAPGVEGRPWPRSTELQIQEHDVGDLYAVGSVAFVRSAWRTPPGGAAPVYEYDPKGTWNAFAQVPGTAGRCVKAPDNEKKTGEWNTIELICLGEDSIHIVNGVVVMRLHGMMSIDTPVPQQVTRGPIAFQSEGAEVYYRDISVRAITEIPAEFAEK